MPIIRHIEFFIHICKLLMIKIYNDNKFEILSIIAFIIIFMILYIGLIIL